MLRQHKGRRGGWCHSQPSSSLHCPRFPPWYQAGRRLPPRWERDHLQSLFFSPQVHWTSVLLMWPSSFPGEFFGDNFERRHTWGGNQAADICIGAPIAIGPQMAFIMAPGGESTLGRRWKMFTSMAAARERGFQGWKEKRKTSKGRAHSHTKGPKDLTR